MFKAYSDRIRTFSYYMGTEDEPKPVLGLLLDMMLLLAGIFCFLYIWLVYRTKQPVLSLVISLTVTSLFCYGLYFKKRGTYKRKRSQMRNRVAREYMQDGLSVLSRQEFEWQLIRALSSLEGLTNIEQRQGYLKALYNGMPVAIGYNHTPPKGYESYERVWAFYTSLRSRGYTSLFYITSGYYEEACQHISDSNLETPITLLDIDNLLDLMTQAGMGPSQDLLDELVQKRIREIRRKRKYARKGTPARYKLKRYMISSLLFLGASFLFRSYFPFYFVLSILFFVLGLISQVLSSDREEYTSKTP